MRKKFKSVLDAQGEKLFNADVPQFYQELSWRQRLEGIEVNMARLVEGDISALVDFVSLYEKLDMENKPIVIGFMLENHLMTRIGEIKEELYDS